MPDTSPYIETAEVIKLLKQHLGIHTTPSGLRYYIQRKDFPENMKLGYPRRWIRYKVMQWIQQHKSNV